MYFKASLFYHRIRKLSSNLTYTLKKKKKKHCIYKEKKHTQILTKAQKPKRKRKKNPILYDYHLPTKRF